LHCVPRDPGGRCTPRIAMRCQIPTQVATIYLCCVQPPQIRPGVRDLASWTPTRLLDECTGSFEHRRNNGRSQKLHRPHVTVYHPIERRFLPHKLHDMPQRLTMARRCTWLVAMSLVCDRNTTNAELPTCLLHLLAHSSIAQVRRIWPILGIIEYHELPRDAEASSECRDLCPDKMRSTADRCKNANGRR
jgi:hypothetical protein